MNERFLKFIPSEEAFWLMDYRPNAFRLLTHIANTARRYNGHIDGLKIGQCHLQHWEKYNLSEQEYRTAKQVLCKLKFLKIIQTNRTRQKSTTELTTNSTIVEILDSRVWDINSEEANDQVNDRSTTDQRPINDKQEGIRKKKKEKEIQPQTPSFQKIKFRENVQLTQAEFDSLLAKHGQDILDRMLNALDSYKGSSGKTYKSDFHTMKEGGWVIERVRKEMLTANVGLPAVATANEQLGKKLEQRFFNYTKGWRCSIYRDQKKDQRGLLFECENSYVTPHFIAFTNGAFKEEVVNLLRTKNMGDL